MQPITNLKFSGKVFYLQTATKTLDARVKIFENDPLINNINVYVSTFSLIKKIGIILFFLCCCMPLLGEELPKIKYSVRFENEADKPTQFLIKKTTDLYTQKKKIPLHSKEGLQRRVEASLPQIKKILVSQGHFSGFATFEIEEVKKGFEVALYLEKGPLYTIGQSEISYATPLEPGEEPSSEELGIAPGSPASSARILSGQAGAILFLEEKGYGQAKETEFTVLVDPETDTVDIALAIDQGKKLFFGKTIIGGNKSVKTSYIEKKLSYNPKELFSRKKIQESIRKLQKTELFSYISLQLDEEATQNGIAVMRLEVKETPFRSMGAGIGYSTGLGPLALLEWEHRNIASQGQRLLWELNYSPRLQETFLQYKIPDFMQPEQNLIFVSSLKQEKNRAFDSKEAAISGLIERPLTPNIYFQFESRLSRTVVHDAENQRLDRYALSFPLRLNFDYTDNLLNPTYGVNPRFKITPHITIFENNITHVNLEGSIAHFYSLSSDTRWILATKISLGTIQGAKRADILPTERFYGGSSTLLRGYPFKTVSPLDIENKPLGGRSFASLAEEIRVRVGEDWGLAFFTEAGNVYESPTPNVTKKLLWSGGLGAFYETPIGPLRFDIAGPIIRRNRPGGGKFNDPLQFYFTLGHSF